MTTKLTLVVEKSIIEKAKIYAKNTDRSLSEIVESYLISILQENTPQKEISSKLKKIIGSVTLPKSFDERKELEAYLQKKHS